MSLQLHPENDGRILEVHVTGKLAKEDYATFVPEVDRAIEKNGKVSVLFEMHDFHGWKAGALWEDSKFALTHFSAIDRLAVVGEKRWQKGMATFCKPFTRAQVRYFDYAHEGEARAWLHAEPTKA